MTAYRDSASPTAPASRFARTLTARFTRARLWPDRVEVDAVDPTPCTYAALGLLGFTLHLWPWMLRPVGVTFALALLVVALTARAELRVHVGHAVLRRRLLGLTWQALETTSSREEDWFDVAPDSVELVFPGPPSVYVLTTTLHGVREDEVAEIARHARALVASGRRV